MGDQVEGWIKKVNKYFKLAQIPDEQMVELPHSTLLAELILGYIALVLIHMRSPSLVSAGSSKGDLQNNQNMI
jgi:hypothetical protein